MQTPVTTTQPPRDAGPATIPGKLDWLTARYLRNDRDAQFGDYLSELVLTDAEGALLPRQKRNPLNGETRGLAVLGPSGAGKSVMIERNLRALTGWKEFDPNSGGN